MNFSTIIFSERWQIRYSNYFAEELIKHEYGHTIQSKYLGWLYLPVIALPSLIWAGFFGWYREDNGIDYYDFYTEKWANKLGEKVKFKWLGEYEDKEELITNGEE